MRKFDSDFEMVAKSIEEENNSTTQLCLDLGVYENDLKEFIQTALFCRLVIDVGNDHYKITEEGHKYLKELDLKRRKHDVDVVDMVAKGLEEIKVMASSKSVTYTQIRTRLDSLKYPRVISAQVIFEIKEKWEAEKIDGIWKYTPPESK